MSINLWLPPKVSEALKGGKNNMLTINESNNNKIIRFFDEVINPEILYKEGPNITFLDYYVNGEYITSRLNNLHNKIKYYE